MRRMFIIGMATVVLAVPSALALADDDVDEAGPTDENEVVELSDAQMRKAMLIADYFTPDEGETEDEVDTGDDDEDVVDPVLETVLELRSQTGWGAVYKLMLLAQAGVDIEELDGEWGFGRHFKNLTPDQSAAIADAPKNLGQLKKQEREAAKGERKANPGKGKKNG